MRGGGGRGGGKTNLKIVLPHCDVKYVDYAKKLKKTKTGSNEDEKA